MSLIRSTPGIVTPLLVAGLLSSGLLAVGCNGVLSGVGAKATIPIKASPEGTPAPASTTGATTPGQPIPPVSAILVAATGRVLDLAGKPAANVAVRGYLIGDVGAGMVAGGGGNLIGQGGSTLIGQGGSTMVAGGGMNYRLQAASFETRTDATGSFKLDVPENGTLNIEAVQADDVKAIQLGVAATAAAITLQLGYTGTIAGQVKATQDARVTNFEGVDIFIPGTSYTAKADQSGRFTLANVPVGTFGVVASKTGLGRAAATGIAVASKSTASVTLDLALTVPTIAALAPNDGLPGSSVVITGTNFGAATGAPLSVTFGGAVATTVRRENDGRIVVNVPEAAATGDVVVTVDGIASNPVPFRVTPPATPTPGPEQTADPVIRATPTPRPADPGAYTFTIARGAMRVGSAQVFPLLVVDKEKQLAPAKGMAWSVQGEAITVDGAGKVKAREPGYATLTASVGSNSVNLPITVADGPLVETIFLPPPIYVTGGPAVEIPFPPRAFVVDGRGTLFASNGPAVRRYKGIGALLPPVTSLWAGGGSPPFSTPESLDGVGGIAIFIRVVGMAFAGEAVVLTDTAGTVRRLVDRGGGDVLVTTVAGQFVINGPSEASRDGKGTEARFNAPGPIVVGDDGVCYVGDGTRLRRIAPDGTVTTLMGPGGSVSTGTGTIHGLTMQGRKLYIAMGTDVNVLDLTNLGAPTTVHGYKGFQGAWYVAVEPSGVRYTAAAGGTVVFRTVGDGEPMEFAGHGPGQEDGPRAAALFANIRGLVADGAGHLYVQDGEPPLVRRIDLAP